MGHWRDRPRRNFRKQKAPWAAIRNYDNEPPLEFWRDGIPLWEKKFCTEISHVPWRKILDSKRFIYHHLNILNWDDSACEEAFHNAKKRFWAEMNGHHCDIYSPDPNIYIGGIDWNPKIDSKMIEEVDRAYFAPEVEQCDMWLECKNNKTRNSDSVSAEGDIEDRDHSENPWEHGSKCIENNGPEPGWSQWHSSDSGKVNNEGNPWDIGLVQENKGIVDIAWGSSKFKSWDSENGRSHFDEFQAREKGCRNAWNEGRQDSISWRNKGLAGDARRNDRGWENGSNQQCRTLKDRTRPNSRENEEDWKYRDSYRKRPKDAEFEKSGRWGSQSHGCWNQDGPQWSGSSQRCSRPQRDGCYQINSSWRR